jgi:hypothetical protein
VIVAVLLVLVVGAVAAVITTSGDGTSPTAPTTTPTTAPVAGQPLTPARTASFDPLGDGTEKQGRVRDAFDSNPATSWETEGYDDQFGNGYKDGVGLMMEFGDPVEARQLQITFGGGATSFQLLAGDTASNAIGSYQVAATRADASGTVTVPLDNVGAHRYWVLWLTKLPQSGNFKGTVVDLTLRS